MYECFISQLTAGYWQNGWLVGWLVVGWLVGKSRVCLSALRLAISPERVVRSTSFWRAAEGRQAREFVTAGVRKPGEARQRRVYNAIRVHSVPSCKLAPARTRPRVPSDARCAKRGIAIISRPSVRPSACQSVCDVDVYPGRIGWTSSKKLHS